MTASKFAILTLTAAVGSSLGLAARPAFAQAHAAHASAPTGNAANASGAAPASAASSASTASSGQTPSTAGVAGTAGAASSTSPTGGATPSANGENAEVGEDAKKHFRAGVTFLQDPDGERVEDAYNEFKTAYQLSHSPKVLGNLGLCAMKLERDGEAIAAYDEYLKSVSDIDQGERAQIVRDLQTMRDVAVPVTLTFDVKDLPRDSNVTLEDTRRPVRGQPITNLYTSSGANLGLTIRPGHHVMQVRVEGHSPATWEFDASPAKPLQHTFVLTEPATRIEHSHTAPLILTGIGAAAVIAGVVTGIVTLSKVSSTQDECPNGACPVGSSFAADRSTAKTTAALTDVLLFGGGALAVGGITWILLTPNSKGSSQPGDHAIAPATASSEETRSLFSRMSAGGMCLAHACSGSLSVRF